MMQLAGIDAAHGAVETRAEAASSYLMSAVRLLCDRIDAVEKFGQQGAARCQELAELIVSLSFRTDAMSAGLHAVSSERAVLIAQCTSASTAVTAASSLANEALESVARVSSSKWGCGVEERLCALEAAADRACSCCRKCARHGSQTINDELPIASVGSNEICRMIESVGSRFRLSEPHVPQV